MIQQAKIDALPPGRSGGMVEYDAIDWDDPSVEGGNTDHIADNGITIEEYEEVLDSPSATDTVSRSSGRPARIGRTSTGKDIIIVFELGEDDDYVVLRPVTAFEIED
jgi:hypothetical protein